MTNRFMDYSTYKAPQTNADRIRKMSDKELAEVFEKSLQPCHMCIYQNQICVSDVCDCKEGILQWLQSEVKG